MERKTIDIADLIEYRELVNNQPETQFQKITLEIVDKAMKIYGKDADREHLNLFLFIFLVDSFNFQIK